MISSQTLGDEHMAKLLTTAEVGELLGISRKRVSQIAIARGVEPAAVAGTSYLWRRSQLKKLQPGPSGRPKKGARP